MENLNDDRIFPASEPTPLALLRSGGNNRSGPRVLALHGWLDNALSFAPMHGLLDGLELVCLDFPGHGQSPPRPASVRYHFDDYVFDVLATADALGWDRFHLLGHSLGGAVASVLAAACPERIQSLSVIEGLGPLSAPPDQTARGWRKAIDASRERPRRMHAERSAAIDARVRGSDLPREAAELLAERGLVQADGGWHWRHDQRLTWPSTQRYTEPQVLDLLAHIEAPTLCVLAEPRSRVVPEGLMERRAAAVAGLQVHQVAGGHHVHMQQPGIIGELIQNHISSHEPPA
ncbi:MAG: alpha/beta hydrolase [Wenzhouxiangellaceae bacterium]|nr:alpha/beta hydrolase [Wenzhouxiangellaceae bacterium]